MIVRSIHNPSDASLLPHFGRTIFINRKGEVITLRFGHFPTRTSKIPTLLQRPREKSSFMLDPLNHISLESHFQHSPNTMSFARIKVSYSKPVRELGST